MKSGVANNLFHERYVVEIDGIEKAEYQTFVKALKAGLYLRQEFPHCKIKVRDADEHALLPAH
jgi:hypothetical protein